MAITNVDIGKLAKWHNDVKQELEEVDRTLDEVAKVSKECGGDDTIYGVFQKMGEGIANAYLDLTKVFRETMEETKTVIDSLKKGVSNIGEFIQDVADKFTR